LLSEPFKVTAQSRTAVGYLDPNFQWRTQTCQQPFIYCTYSCWWWRYEQIRNLFPIAQWTFLSENFVILCRQRCYERSSILATRSERSSMLPTAQWLLCDVANCAMMPVAKLRPVRIHCRLYKEKGETQFSLWKSRHKSRLSLRRDEFHVHNLFIAPSPTPVYTDRSVCVFGNSFFRIANGCTGRNLDRRIFIKKISVPRSLIKNFRKRKSLISAGSIPLDNTFNKTGRKEMREI
jgi:hypothetical protein